MQKTVCSQLAEYFVGQKLAPAKTRQKETISILCVHTNCFNLKTGRRNFKNILVFKKRDAISPKSNVPLEKPTAQWQYRLDHFFC